jgi:hypothetical protein
VRHALKCHPGPYEATRVGKKLFEIRKEDDKRFSVGDSIELREWSPGSVEIRCNGEVHYRRPVGHPDVAEAEKTEGYVIVQDAPARYTGRTLLVQITHVERGPDWGLPVGLVVLGIASPEIGEAVSTSEAIVQDRKLVERLCRFAKGMTPFEVEFLEDVARRVKQRTMTHPQRRIAERIDRERVP